MQTLAETIKVLRLNLAPTSVCTTDNRQDQDIEVGDILASCEMAEAYFKQADSIFQKSIHLRDVFSDTHENCRKTLGIGTYKTTTPSAELQMAIAKSLTGTCLYPNRQFLQLVSSNPALPEMYKNADDSELIDFSLLCSSAVHMAISSVAESPKCDRIVRNAAQYMTTGRRVSTNGGTGCLLFAMLIPSILIMTLI